MTSPWATARPLCGPVGRIGATIPKREQTSFAALRHRDFALLWSGQSVSQVGDGILTVALALEALTLTHRPSGFALVIAARMVPSILLTVVSGVIVDRVSRQLAMLVSDAVRALAVGLIAGLIATGRLRLWELVVMSIVFGIADSFFGPAVNAVMPELLDTELLVQGNALASTSQQLASGFLGPAVGASSSAPSARRGPSRWTSPVSALVQSVSHPCAVLAGRRAVRRRSSRTRARACTTCARLGGCG